MNDEEKPIWECWVAGTDYFVERMRELNFKVEYIGKPRRVTLVHDPSYNQGVQHLAAESRSELEGLADSSGGDGIVVLDIKKKKGYDGVDEGECDYTVIPYKLVPYEDKDEEE